MPISNRQSMVWCEQFLSTVHKVDGILQSPVHLVNDFFFFFFFLSSAQDVAWWRFPNEIAEGKRTHLHLPAHRPSFWLLTHLCCPVACPKRHQHITRSAVPSHWGKEVLYYETTPYYIIPCNTIPYHKSSESLACHSLLSPLTGGKEVLYHMIPHQITS